MGRPYTSRPFRIPPLALFVILVALPPWSCSQEEVVQGINSDNGVNNYAEFSPPASLSSLSPLATQKIQNQVDLLEEEYEEDHEHGGDHEHEHDNENEDENESDLTDVFGNRVSVTSTSSSSKYPPLSSPSSFSTAFSNSHHNNHNHNYNHQREKYLQRKRIISNSNLNYKSKSKVKAGLFNQLDPDDDQDFDFILEQQPSTTNSDIDEFVTLPTKNYNGTAAYFPYESPFVLSKASSTTTTRRLDGDKAKIRSKMRDKHNRLKQLRKKNKIRAKVKTKTKLKDSTRRWRRHHRDVSSLSVSQLDGLHSSSSSMATLLAAADLTSVASAISTSEENSDRFFVTFRESPKIKIVKQTKGQTVPHAQVLSIHNNKNSSIFPASTPMSMSMSKATAMARISSSPSASPNSDLGDEDSFQNDAEIPDNEHDHDEEHVEDLDNKENNEEDEENMVNNNEEFQPPSGSIRWASTFPQGATCRHHADLPPLAYQLNTCAWCYQYIPNIPQLFVADKKYYLEPFRSFIQDPFYGNLSVLGLTRNDSKFNDTTLPKFQVLANISDSKSPLIATFANLDARKKWIDCCEAAETCCKKIQKLPTAVQPSNPSDKNYCPKTWDGWTCWPDTPGGQVAEAFCPHYIFFMTEQTSCRTSFPKVCIEDGTWQKRYTKEWTNYTTCATAGITLQKNRTHVHIIAYAVSIIALIPALGVFFAYKQLRTHRIILHRNLFLSMLLNGLLVIAFRGFVILKDLETDKKVDSIINENGVSCRILLILTKYSRMTNYMWCFCEGYYLHKLISAAFAEQKSLLVFYLLGWGFPIIPTAIYAGLRLYNANALCWAVPEPLYDWVLNLPSLLSLLINLGFLINIIRVLVTKIRATHTNEPSQYRKAVRATLVLLPLFGLHFLLTIYRVPTGDCEWIELYYYMNNTLDGLQGFLVALIFCYVNGEVVTLFKRSYSRWREQHNTGCHRQQSRLGGGANNGGGGGGGRNGRGRSVVSTYYSSVPASPTQTRLTITNTEMNTAGGLLTPGSAGSMGGAVTTPDGFNSPPPPYSKVNSNLNSNAGKEFEKDKPTKMTNGNSLSLLVTNVDTGTWSEIKLGGGGEDSVEMKQAFSLNPSPISISNNSHNSNGPPKNGILSEHQL